MSQNQDNKPVFTFQPDNRSAITEGEDPVRPSGRYSRVKNYISTRQSADSSSMTRPANSRNGDPSGDAGEITLFGEEDASQEHSVEDPSRISGPLQFESKDEEEDDISLGFESFESNESALIIPMGGIIEPADDDEQEMIAKMRANWDLAMDKVQSEMLTDRNFNGTMRRFLWNLYAGDIPVNDMSDMLRAFMIARKFFETIRNRVGEKRYMSYFFRQLAPRLVRVKDGYNNSFMHYILYLDRGGARNFIYCAHGLGEWCRRHERGGMDRSGDLRRATTEFLIGHRNTSDRTAMDLAQLVLNEEEQERLKITLTQMISAMAREEQFART